MVEYEKSLTLKIRKFQVNEQKALYSVLNFLEPKNCTGILNWRLRIIKLTYVSHISKCKSACCDLDVKKDDDIPILRDGSQISQNITEKS